MSTPARFVHGSTAWHVVSMALTGAIGLVTVFLVDFIDIYFIAQLGTASATAGVGFAMSLLFFVRSAGLALSIATGMLVARALGAGHEAEAKRFAAHATLLALVLVSLLALLVWHWHEGLLRFLGAEGEALRSAETFLGVVLSTAPCLTAGLCGGQVLRALGQGSRSMVVSSSTALLNGLLDPLLIFGLGWGLFGAALATALAQLGMALLAWWVLAKRFAFIDLGRLGHFRWDVPVIAGSATPVLLTNLASPLVGAFTARAMASFGDEATAGYVIITRFFPLAAAVILALSGAVAPIVGQNAGAKRFDRVRLTLLNALWFNWLLALLVTLALRGFQREIVGLFDVGGTGRELLLFFTSGLSLLLGFDGMIFFTIAAFNNLGRPFLGTLTNFARIIVGAVPLILLGQYFLGARGVLLGYMTQNVLVACVAYALLLRLVRQREREP